MGDHHGIRSQRHSSQAMDMGKIVGQKAWFELDNI